MCTISWTIIGVVVGLGVGLIVSWAGWMISKVLSLRTVRWIGLILCGALGGLAGFWFSQPCNRLAGMAGPAGLNATANIRQVETVQQFDSAVLNSQRPVVVDFFATWCGPCRIQSPIMDSLADRYAGRADFVKVDTDKSPDVAQRYDVRVLPTIVLFRGGKAVERWEGVTDANQLASAIDAELPSQPASQAAIAPADIVERGSLVTARGKPVTLLGPELKVGMEAPDSPLVANDMSQFKLSSLRGKKVIVCTVPSLDTAVCSTETRKFNEKAGSLGNGVAIVAVSMDLPFAQARWCGAEGIKNVRTVSDYRGAAFGQACGLLMKESHLLARCVFIVDSAGKVRYIQLVPETTREPDYDAVFEALANIK